MTLPFDEGFVPPPAEDGRWVSRDEWRTIALTAVLDVAVPLKMQRMADWTPEQRIRYARNRWALMTGLLDKGGLSGGAELLTGGGERVKDEFVVLTGVLAALAYQPGGVTFGGMHWCTDHGACEMAALEAVERVNA